MNAPGGLVLRNKKFSYGHGFGFGTGWLPWPVQHVIGKYWNRFACRVWGHDWLPDFSTATWWPEPCHCEEPYRSYPEHQQEHEQPHNWTHRLCTACSTRQEHADA